MNKKVLTLSAVMASLLFGAHAQAADTRIGVTIYKYDDNFMSVVRKAIEKDGKLTFYWRKGLKLWRLTWSTRQPPVR